MLRTTIFWCILVFFTIKCVISYEIKKCCPLNHIVNSEMNGCVVHKNNQKSKDWIIPTGILNNLPTTFKQSVPSIGKDFNIPCSSPRTMALTWKNDNNLFNFQTDKKTGDLKTVVKNKTFPVDDYCLDEMLSEDKNKLISLAMICKCNQGLCVNLCCENGKYLNLDNSSSDVCEPINSWPENQWKIDNISVPEIEQQYFTTSEHNSVCATGTEIQLKQDPTENVYFKILANGTLYFQINDENGLKLQEHWLGTKEYSCVGLMSIDGIIEANAFICEQEETLEENIRSYVYRTFLLIAVIFFFITFMIHLILPKLRKDRKEIKGMSLMSHCACMLVTYICHFILTMVGGTVPDIPCKVLGYLEIYSLFAGYFWLHVLCIDIATTFRSLQNMVHNNSYHGKCKRVLLYIGLAMGLPIIIVIITYLADLLLDPEKYANIKPNIGKGSCFFQRDQYGIIIFFYGPLGLVLVLNLILFLFSAYKIFNFMRTPELKGQNDRMDIKKRVTLSIKLFALMGVPWIFEIIISLIGSGFDYYWVFIDATHAVRSIFLFILFCWKREVWIMLDERFGLSRNNTIKSLNKKFRQSEAIKNDNSNEIMQQNSNRRSLDTQEETIM